MVEVISEELMEQRDLFGEEVHEFQIDGNPMLASICRHILDLKSRNPNNLNEKIKNANSIGEVDKMLLISIWLDDGLRGIITDTELRGKVTSWMLSKACLDPDAIGRARRFLMSKGEFPVPTKLIVDAEHHRERIARSVKT